MHYIYIQVPMYGKKTQQIPATDDNRIPKTWLHYSRHRKKMPSMTTPPRTRESTPATRTKRADHALFTAYLEHGKVVEHPCPEGRDVQEAYLIGSLLVVPGKTKNDHRMS